MHNFVINMYRVRTMRFGVVWLKRARVILFVCLNLNAERCIHFYVRSEFLHCVTCTDRCVHMLQIVSVSFIFLILVMGWQVFRLWLQISWQISISYPNPQQGKKIRRGIWHRLWNDLFIRVGWSASWTSFSICYIFLSKKK